MTLTAVVRVEKITIEGGLKNTWVSQWARKFKKVQATKTCEIFFFYEIAFLAVLNFFPVQKFIFGHF